MRFATPTLCTLVCLCLAPPSTAQDWTKSKWGPADVLGSANYVTPERVVAAASLVKLGKSYTLGMITGSKTPAFPPRKYDLHVWEAGFEGSTNRIT